MIKIAHEVPVDFMQEMQKHTDYDYALACLFDKVPGYYEYFEQALKDGRHVLLDNGVFEDGKPMDEQEYAAWIDRLKPTEYIVPDIFDEAAVTVTNFHRWLATYKNLPGQKIGVVQGKNLSEMTGCYEYMSSYADKIAINFASIAYQSSPLTELMNNIPSNTWDFIAVYGRVMFIRLLLDGKTFNQDKPHHLLGCSLPIEFQLLKETPEGLNDDDDLRMIDYFDTMDTSAPVVWGLLNGKYPADLGTITKKNKTKLKDLITTKPTPEQTQNILANAALFREYLA